MAEGSEEKKCSKCRRVIPPGLLICPVCALRASGVECPERIHYELMSGGNETNRSAGIKIRRMFPETQAPKKGRKGPREDLGDNLPLDDAPPLMIL